MCKLKAITQLVEKLEYALVDKEHPIQTSLLEVQCVPKYSKLPNDEQFLPHVPHLLFVGEQ
jgi:hypothetical protein